MLLSLKEFVTWTGLSIFEIWLHCLALLISTILLAIKLHEVFTISYWTVFSPLLLASALNCYFLFIVAVRTLIETREIRNTISRYMFPWIRLVMIALFELLLCNKVEGDFEHQQVAARSTYGMVFLPIWTLLVAQLFLACRLF